MPKQSKKSNSFCTNYITINILHDKLGYRADSMEEIYPMSKEYAILQDVDDIDS